MPIENLGRSPGDLASRNQLMQEGLDALNQGLIRELAKVLEVGLAERVRAGKALQKEWPEILKGLIEAAKGVYCERLVPRRGNDPVKRIVYQRPPDPKAASFLARLSGMSPDDMGSLVFQLAKSRREFRSSSILLDVQADMMRAQTDQMRRVTLAMDRTIVDSEMVTRAVMEMCRELISVLQTTSVSEYPSTEDEKSGFVERVADRVIAAKDRLFYRIQSGDFATVASLPSGSGEEGGDDEE